MILVILANLVFYPAPLIGGCLSGDGISEFYLYHPFDPLSDPHPSWPPRRGEVMRDDTPYYWGAYCGPPDTAMLKRGRADFVCLKPDLMVITPGGAFCEPVLRWPVDPGWLWAQAGLDLVAQGNWHAMHNLWAWRPRHPDIPHPLPELRLDGHSACWDYAAACCECNWGAGCLDGDTLVSHNGIQWCHEARPWLP